MQLRGMPRGPGRQGGHEAQPARLRPGCRPLRPDAAGAVAPRRSIRTREKPHAPQEHADDDARRWDADRARFLAVPGRIGLDHWWRSRSLAERSEYRTHRGAAEACGLEAEG